MAARDFLAIRSRNTYKTLTIGLTVVLAGFIALWLAETWHGAISAFASALGSLLVVTGGISLLWNLQGKRDFVEEVIARARLSADVEASGLQRVTMRWLEDVEWEKLFREATRVEVFLSYGRSWRSHHASRIDRLLKRRDARVSLYLPDPESQATIEVLAARYDSTPEKIRSEINEAASDFAKRSEDSQADVRVYFRPYDPVFACYRFDDKVVMTLYSHRRRRGDVPTFVAERGLLSEFFIEELNAIRDQSRPVNLGKLLENGGSNGQGD